MAAKKEYEAILALGGKLQGSFGAAFGAAKKQMQSLGKAAQAVGKVFGTVFRGFQLALGGMAAFALGKVFSNIFGGAEKAAKDALKRTQLLTAALTANPKLQKLGTDAIQGQVLALQKVSAELGKQGVVHSDHFEVASRTLALFGMGPQTIAKMLPVLGDTLVATKGVNASVEDMEKLTEAVTKAINPGQVKGLQEVGIVMSKNDKKAWDALKPTQRQTKLVEILTQKYQEANKAAADTDLGKIQIFENTMAGFSEEMGKSMIPMQAKMAEFWSKTLPGLEPIAKKVFEGIANAMGDTAKLATDVVVPAIEKTAKFFESPEWLEGVKKLGDAFNTLGGALKPLAEALGLSTTEGFDFGQWLSGEIIQTIEEFAALIEGTAKVIRKIGDAFNWIKGVWDAAGPALTKIGDDMKAGFDKGYQAAKAVWDKLPEIFSGAEAAVKAAIDKVAEAIKKPFLDAFNAIKKVWDDLVSAFTNFKFPEFKMPRMPWQKPEGAQYGGIFTRPAIRQIAEAGTPEAVIPLNRSARSQGLLGAAAAAIGGGAGAGAIGGGRSTLNFAPNVSIAGNATRETVTELDRSLRNLADDFLAKFTQAQEQERRLAFS